MKKPCPICKKAPSGKNGLFCSPRCEDIDLGRWLKGNYSFPGQDGEAVIPANDTSPDNDL